MYWVLIPKSKRRKCIFKKSCSHYVFDITKEKGLSKGIIALRYRYKNCRPGYNIIYINNTKMLISANNELFPFTEIATRILKSKHL